MFMLYEPPTGADRVRMEEFDPPLLRRRWLKSRAAVAPVETIIVRLIIPLNVCRLVSAIVTVALRVALMVTLLWVAIVKSGVATRRWTTTELAGRLLFVAVTVMLYLPGETVGPTLISRKAKPWVNV